MSLSSGVNKKLSELFPVKQCTIRLERLNVPHNEPYATQDASPIIGRRPPVRVASQTNRRHSVSPHCKRDCSGIQVQRSTRTPTRRPTRKRQMTTEVEHSLSVNQLYRPKPSSLDVADCPAGKDVGDPQRQGSPVCLNISTQGENEPEERLIPEERNLIARQLQELQDRLQMASRERAEAQRAASSLEQEVESRTETLAVKEAQANGLMKEMEDLFIRKAKVDCEIQQLREKLLTITGQELPLLRHRISARFAEEELLYGQVRRLREIENSLRKSLCRKRISTND